jgi:hypothetical protein
MYVHTIQHFIKPPFTYNAALFFIQSPCTMQHFIKPPCTYHEALFFIQSPCTMQDTFFTEPPCTNQYYFLLSPSVKCSIFKLDHPVPCSIF